MEATIEKLEQCEIAEIELVYRSTGKKFTCQEITCSKQLYELILSTWNLDKIELQEQFKVILLDTRNVILGILELSTGGIIATTVDPRLIFAAALKAKALSIFLVHNHPSGNLKPSQPDIELTNKIKEAGKLLDIRVLDHLIVSKDGYFSMADEGLL